MRKRLRNIFRLGVKELNSLRRDPVLLFLIFFTFTVAIYTVATGVRTEIRNASIAFADEDGSQLSRQIRDAFLKPYFKEPALLTIDQIDPAMDAGRYAFVIDIPAGFQADVLAGRQPRLQVNVDATAMTLAGNGAAYIQNIINRELATFTSRSDAASPLEVRLSMRTKFNPNLDSSWFMAVMQVVSNVTMLSLILSGAAVIRERERGTIEHLLVMPVTPGEIMLAKIWANGLAIVLAVIVSLYVVVQGILAVRITGSIGLFVFGSTAVSLCNDGAWHCLVDDRKVDAAIRASGYSVFHRHEHAVGGDVSARRHASDIAGPDAGSAVDALHELRTSSALSRRWPRSRLATAPGNGCNWDHPFQCCPVALPCDDVGGPLRQDNAVLRCFERVDR